MWWVSEASLEKWGRGVNRIEKPSQSGVAQSGKGLFACKNNASILGNLSMCLRSHQVPWIISTNADASSSKCCTVACQSSQVLYQSNDTRYKEDGTGWIISRRGCHGPMWAMRPPAARRRPTWPCSWTRSTPSAGWVRSWEPMEMRTDVPWRTSPRWGRCLPREQQYMDLRICPEEKLSQRFWHNNEDTVYLPLLVQEHRQD